MKPHRNERGLTLIETLLAMGISAIIIAGLAAGIYAIVSISGRGNDHIQALQDIQSAAHWINHDAQMANSATLPGGSRSDNITLAWIDQNGASHSSVIALSGNELIRNYDGTVMSIAWNVDSAEFSVNGEVLLFTIRSIPGGIWNVERDISGQVNMRAVP